MNRLQMKKWIQRKGDTENKVDTKSVSREKMNIREEIQDG